MLNPEESAFVSDYLHQVLGYLRADLGGYFRAKAARIHVGCGPFLLTTCSGIDFLGSVSVPDSLLDPKVQKCKTLDGKSKAGFCYYTKKFLGQVDGQYAADKMPEYLYKVLRCGQVHEAIVKRGVILGDKAGRKYHLKNLPLMPPDKFFYFNSEQFAADFTESFALFTNAVNQDNSIAKTIHDRLKDYESELGSLPPVPVSVTTVSLDDTTRALLYDSSSASPLNPGSSTLKKKFWENIR